ncbi:uncharacterized protein LOC117291806 [Asterias rubens]|uniref:uncharacterized protein LOC117291806 n=1 Tax=Asterias rubens TaxID=7604 RepID=UPI00145523AF|nr:uncharacterized protein LOC117291806 [Asterias rubens]
MVALGVFAALLTFTSVVAHTCYFSQEPNHLVNSDKYHWVLSDNPCLCAQFRLGGINTVPSKRATEPIIRSFDASLLRKRPDDIRDAMGCVKESSLYNTTASGKIMYPFDSFNSALLVYIDVTASKFRIYLTTEDLSSPPPYKIEFKGDRLSVAKLLHREPGVYTDVASEVIPGSAADGRHFWLYYRYGTSSAVIQVGLGQSTTEYFDQSPLQETTYLGTFSSEAAEWNLRHYQKT